VKEKKQVEQRGKATLYRVYTFLARGPNIYIKLLQKIRVSLIERRIITGVEVSQQYTRNILQTSNE
jgi:hypothetical protein